MPVAAFNALALLNVYFHADLAYKGVDKASRRREKLKILHDHGYLKQVRDVENSNEAVKALYDEVIEEWIGMLPEGWEPTYDRWGAKCACYKPGWKAPETGTLFAGDRAGHYMTFDSAAAVGEYLQRELADLDEKERPDVSE
jgi:hypothetical protein